MSLPACRWLLVLAVFASFGNLFAQSPQDAVSSEAVPLHHQIDAVVAQTQFGAVADLCDDPTFLRRIYLDLTGRIPTIDETRSFFADDQPDKRARLVEKLISSEEFTRQMAVAFDVMLMERRGGKHVKPEEFRSYLEASFREGKSYRKIVEEILSADGSEEKQRSASAFYLERELTPDLMTREIGRVFYGVDLQCAQCHNHPNVEDYLQDDYYGLKAFVLRASLHQPDKKQPALIAEKADGEADFKSVFTDRSSAMGPLVPGGDEVAEVILRPDQQYAVAPAKDVRHIPTHSRLETLAEVVTSNPTPQFNRNIANRIWGYLYGKPLVTPVDLHHSGNPASHPQLLELLASSFAATDYDVKSFVREIVLSETYQRSARLPVSSVTVSDLSGEIAALEAEATKERELSYQVDQQLDAAIETLDAAFAELAPLQAEIDKANKAVAEAMKVRDEAESKVTARQKEISGKEANTKLVIDAYEKAKAASEALKDDKELASATETLKKKTDAFNAEIAKLRETEKVEVAALATANEKLVATHPPADAAIAAIQPAQEKVRNVRKNVFDLRAKSVGHRRNSSLAATKAAQLKTQSEYLAARERIQQLREAIPQQEQVLLAAQNELPGLEQKIAESSSQLATVTQQLEAAAQTVTSTESKMAEVSTTRQVLADSLAKLNEAIARLETMADLAQAQASIAGAMESIDKDLVAMSSQLGKEKGTLTSAMEAHGVAVKNLETAKSAQMQKLQAVAGLKSQLDASRQELTASQEKEMVLRDSVIEQSASRLNAAEVVGLTPEQLGWSVLVASGQHDRQVATQLSKLNKEQPLSEEDLKDPVKVATREQQSKDAAYAVSRNSVERFIQLYGAEAGQPQNGFFATADQALFFANGGEVRSWLAPASGNLTDRLSKLEDPRQLAEELYLTVLCRQPNELETKDVADYLTARSDQKSAAVQELAWALMTSAEFRFSY